MGRIKTALILAAGIGKRLKPITNSIPKCLIEVEDVPLLCRNIESFINLGFEKIIIVTGYKSDLIEEEIRNYTDQIDITTIWNPVYDKTNNIYSLWLANSMIDEPFVLLESDLFLGSDVLSYFQYPDLIALDLYDPEKHCGTTAYVDSDGYCLSLNICDKSVNLNSGNVFKTVNIYSFSIESWSKICKRLQYYVQNKNLNIFYEVAIADLIKNGSVALKMVDFSDHTWHEIDTHEDLSQLISFLKDHSLNVTAQ